MTGGNVHEVSVFVIIIQCTVKTVESLVEQSNEAVCLVILYIEPSAERALDYKVHYPNIRYLWETCRKSGK